MRYLASLVLPLSLAVMYGSTGEPQKRIRESASVLSDIMTAKDRGIPQDLLQKAQCVGVVPGLKRAGLVVGGEYGKGVLVCRAAGPSGWSAPSMIRITGGSVGLQIGAGETDLVFLVMNQRGMEKLMKDKFTFGADASAMAGPVGRSSAANTDATMHAEILSYSRARGVFAGISLDGATLRPDREENRALYARPIMQQEILTGQVTPPESAHFLYAELNRYAGGKRSAS